MVLGCICLVFRYNNNFERIIFWHAQTVIVETETATFATEETGKAKAEQEKQWGEQQGRCHERTESEQGFHAFSEYAGMCPANLCACARGLMDVDACMQRKDETSL